MGPTWRGSFGLHYGGTWCAMYHAGDTEFCFASKMMAICITLAGLVGGMMGISVDTEMSCNVLTIV